jgi:L-alanine-DL-glutamate epimerase-like enolase superfamily enzyme
MMPSMRELSRRGFLSALSAGAFGAFDLYAAPERGRAKIADIKVMVLQGPRTYTLVKIVSDQGVHGIGEAYGSPAVGVKEGVLEIRSALIGKDPLDIESLFAGLGARAGASPHALLRGVSGIEAAAWDLAGRLLGVPVCTLLGGRFRDRVRVYHDEGPVNMLDRSSVQEWADRMKAHPAGFTAFKLSLPRSNAADRARDRSKRLLTPRELREIRTGLESCRNAIGSDYDIIVQCNSAFSFGAAAQLADALDPIQPLALEGAMPPDYSEAWPRLVAAAKVPILMSEILGRRHGFKDFIVNYGCDIVQLDVRNTGGLLEAKKIADLAETFYLPVAAHNSGGAVCNLATAHWAAAVRDFVAAETVVGGGSWMDDVILRDGPLVREGHIAVPEKPGFGIDLNPEVVKANLAKGEKYWG